MVFGNSGDNSGTGVAFTRNPATGRRRFFGEYLINAQGRGRGRRRAHSLPHLQAPRRCPRCTTSLPPSPPSWKQHYKDMQDMEFTIENGKLYMLQTRNGKRTAAAALKVAVDLVDEGMISEKEAVLRVEPKQLDSCSIPVRPRRPEEGRGHRQGPGRLPGAACARWSSPPRTPRPGMSGGEKVVLVRLETSRGYRGACRSPRAS